MRLVCENKLLVCDPPVRCLSEFQAEQVGMICNMPASNTYFDTARTRRGCLICKKKKEVGRFISTPDRWTRRIWPPGTSDLYKMENIFGNLIATW